MKHLRKIILLEQSREIGHSLYSSGTIDLEIMYLLYNESWNLLVQIFNSCSLSPDRKRHFGEPNEVFDDRSLNPPISEKTSRYRKDRTGCPMRPYAITQR